MRVFISVCVHTHVHMDVRSLSERAQQNSPDCTRAVRRAGKRKGGASAVCQAVGGGTPAQQVANVFFQSLEVTGV